MNEKPIPTRRRKVCHVLHLDGPGGGPRSVCRHLETFNVEDDPSVIHGGWGCVAELCERLRIPHWRLPLDELHTLPLGFVALVFKLRKIGPDAVMLHGQWAGPIGAIAARVARLKNVTYVCRWPAFYTDWDLFRCVRNRVSESVPCTLADRVVTLSERSRYQYLLRRLAPPEKVQTIPNMIDVATVPAAHEIAAIRQRHGWKPDQVNIVSVGRLEDQKRVDWLLRSWKIVTEKAKGVRLWIVGDGSEKAKLEALAAEIGLGESCVFVGEQERGIAYMAAADFVVMTSTYESFGFVPLEAMVCGKAIVASAVDGVTDTVADGVEGFLVRPADVTSFAGRMLELIGNRDLQSRMGANGRERARQFAPVGIVEKYRRLMQDLCASVPAVTAFLCETAFPSLA